MSKSLPAVFIIEDDEAVSRALQCLFKSVKLSVEIFNSCAAFLENISDQRKGCVVADIRMPGMSGLDLQDELKKRANKLPIIFITGHGDVAMAVRAMKAGAFDFITKPFSNQILLEQVQHAISLTPVIARKINMQKYLQTLTIREREVLNLIVNGRQNKEIALLLKISISTVEMHRSNVMNKTQAKNIAELIRNYCLVEEESGREWLTVGC